MKDQKSENKSRKLSTDELDKLLSKIGDPADLADMAPDEELTPYTLSEYLDILLGRHARTKSEVIERSNLSRDYVYQIFSGLKKHVARDKILQLAFGLGATPEETDALLRAAGHNGLYARSKRDAIIRVFLANGGTLYDCNSSLGDFGFEMLDGEGA